MLCARPKVRSLARKLFFAGIRQMQVVMGVNYITVQMLGILKDVESFSLVLICLRTSSTCEKTLPKEMGVWECLGHGPIPEFLLWCI